MKNNRSVVILVVVGFAFLAGVIIYLLVGPNKSQTITRPTEQSQFDLTGVITIDNTDGLSSILLPEQYDAAYNATSDYVLNKISKNIRRATIVGSPSVANDGTVSFTVKTDNPTKQFDVQITRKDFDRITYIVPSTGYVQVIQVYGKSAD